MGVVILATLTGNQLIHLQIPNLTVLLLCAILVLLNAPLHYYFFVIKKKKVTHLDSKLADRFTYFQLAIDWIFLTLLFHYTGGIASPLLFYLLFHVVLSGVLLKRWVCLLYNTLIALTINLLALMELGGVISHIYGASFISRDVQKNPFFVLLFLFFSTAVLYISSSFVALLLERLRERLRGVKAIQHKLEQDNKELRSLNQLYRGISSTLGLSPRLDFICKSIMEVMGVKGVAIRLIDEKTNRLELASATGLSEAYLNKGPVDADKSLVKALEGEPHFVLDASTDPAVQYPEEARKEGIVSMLAFPLKGRERLIGTLRLYTDKRRYFSQYERGFLSALSSQAAIFIENAKIQDTLERQDEAKSEFIMSMTHELKGPLMAIQGIVDVMLKGYVGSLVEKQRELISRIYKRIDSVMEISGGLLDIYQWQSRRPDVKQVPLSIKEQIQRAVDLFKASAQEKGLNLTGALPDEDLILMGTEDEMEKILNNLITNAIKYTPSGGSILLEPSTSESHLILRVKDTGIGIPEDDIPKIFEESFRTKEAKKIDPYGKGLGLHFVKKVVETLGGSIRVKSDKGKGTEFILAFPKA
ncbi:MAG: GAF domain-containing sensor histidine kinase [Deltaproteobacteria bacterium]|nr:MAG: GAF domain-containing sensor histidine kinase [Deltaproteobacteria bacterium]